MELNWKRNLNFYIQIMKEKYQEDLIQYGSPFDLSINTEPSNLTCVRAKRLRKGVARGRDRRKELIWKATTGRGYNRRVRVCSVKFANTFCELKKRTMATLVAMSTESTSLPASGSLLGNGLPVWGKGNLLI